MKTGLDGFDDDVGWHAEFFASRGIAVYAELLRTTVRLLEQGQLGGLRDAWKSRSFAAQYERPLLLCASLRRDALADARHPLAPFIGDGSSGGAAAPASAIVEALAESAPALRSLRDRYVQTNEISRSVGWRLALSRFGASPKVALFDLGCSAALNLVADRVSGLSWNVELPPTANLAYRVGIDRAPVDIGDPEARVWLRSCLWPGQTERERRLRDAISAAVAARDSGELVLETAQAEAMPALLTRFSEEHPDVPVLAFQSSFLTYLPPDTLKAYSAGMHAWLRASGARALWVEFEDARDTTRGPAETRATWAEGDAIRSRILGWSEHHPMLINLEESALAWTRSSPSGV
jgi:hypothetical protein